MYWVYQTRVSFWRRQWVQACLVSPSTHWLTGEAREYGFRSPMQNEPYGIDLALTYQINPKHPHPDNYLDSFGFSLYSKRLVELMQSFGVRSEVFPATLVDKQGNVQSHLQYYVFHLLEGVLPAMDEEQSGWTGDHDIGIPRLVLDYGKFEHRPIFKCNHIYVHLMRDDLKQEIQRQGITGFGFLAPGRYRSGSFGLAPDFND